MQPTQRFGDVTRCACRTLLGVRLPVNLPDLPVRAVLAEVAAALTEHGTAVLVAPPGTGKTTVVPLALAEATAGKIVVAEPRRLAARAAAARMAALIGEPVGGSVGYAVRGDRRTSKDTRIEVVTTGLLVRRLQSDPSLPGVGTVAAGRVPRTPPGRRPAAGAAPRRAGRPASGPAAARHLRDGRHRPGRRAARAGHAGRAGARPHLSGDRDVPAAAAEGTGGELCGTRGPHGAGRVGRRRAGVPARRRRDRAGDRAARRCRRCRRGAAPRQAGRRPAGRGAAAGRGPARRAGDRGRRVQPDGARRARGGRLRARAGAQDGSPARAVRAGHHPGVGVGGGAAGRPGGTRGGRAGVPVLAGARAHDAARAAGTGDPDGRPDAARAGAGVLGHARRHGPGLVGRAAAGRAGGGTSGADGARGPGPGGRGHRQRDAASRASACIPGWPGRCWTARRPWVRRPRRRSSRCWTTTHSRRARRSRPHCGLCATTAPATAPGAGGGRRAAWRTWSPAGGTVPPTRRSSSRWPTPNGWRGAGRRTHACT